MKFIIFAACLLAISCEPKPLTPTEADAAINACLLRMFNAAVVKNERGETVQVLCSARR